MVEKFALESLRRLSCFIARTYAHTSDVFFLPLRCLLLLLPTLTLLAQQESLFRMEGFNFGWSLGMLEAVGVLAGSMLERAHSADARKRVAPFKSYVVLAGILGMSSSLSNMALNYIKYPTKVRLCERYVERER